MRATRPAVGPLLRVYVHVLSIRPSLFDQSALRGCSFAHNRHSRISSFHGPLHNLSNAKRTIGNGKHPIVGKKFITTLKNWSTSKEEPQNSFAKEDTSKLYTRLRSLAISEDTFVPCRDLATYLVRERRQQPNLQLYNALILSNVCNRNGSAWRVHDILQEMSAEGLQPDVNTCHAILEVLAVHPDHLLRADVLEYMQSRWFQISDDGRHLIAAGLFREGLYEQGLLNLNELFQRNIRVEDWLWDIAIHQLCGAGEIEAAYRLILQRHQSNATHISRITWFTVLDSASSARHCSATRLVWRYRVQAGYLNPPVGVCTNALMTASSSGDSELATIIFSHMADRRIPYELSHYDLLIAAYLSGRHPDIARAISLLSIMASQNMEPTPVQTRTLFAWLRKNPHRVDDAFSRLRELHASGQKIPIAALNLLIECYIEQDNLDKAMKTYKTIHTFVPIEEGAKPSFANIDTINLLLKGCRKAAPPNENLASFLISEMIALRIQPTALTYDRLILVFVRAAARCSSNRDDISPRIELIGWAYRHFLEMQPHGWLPRKGTISQLAVALAEQGDDRCWDVLQTAEDNGHRIENWDLDSTWLRARIESAWALKDQQQLVIECAEISNGAHGPKQ